MLIELLERWRGVDRWPETTATVYSVTKRPGDGMRDWADVTFRYTDGDGGYQAGCYTVDSYTSLYNVEADDTFSIRYNPARPEEYFSSDYESTAESRLWGFLISGAIFLVAVIWLLVQAFKQ